MVIDGDIKGQNWDLGNGYTIVIASAPFGEFATIFLKGDVLWVGKVEALKDAVAKRDRERLN